MSFQASVNKELFLQLEEQEAEIEGLKTLIRKMAIRLDSFGYPYPRQSDMDLLKQAREATK